MNKEIVSSSIGLPKVIEGITLAIKAASSTLGPKGLPVICSASRVSKDGKTVVDSITGFEDNLHQVGLEFVKRVADEVAESSGDSTTTALVLFESLVKHSTKYTLSGYDPSQITLGMDAAMNDAVAHISNESQPVKKDDPKLEHLATISCNGRSSVGKQVAEIMSKIGHEGFVNIENANSIDTTYTFAEGSQITAGYKSQFFITNKEKSICELDNPLIVLYDKSLNNYQDIGLFSEHVLSSADSGRPIFIICDKCEGIFMNWLNAASAQGALKVCAIEIPGYGDKSEIIADIQAMTGATLVSPATGNDLKKFDKSFFGAATKVVCDTKSTSIIISPANVSKVRERAEYIAKHIDANKDTFPQYQINNLNERRRRLLGLVCTYRVGGLNEVERKALHDLVEDAILAAQSALRSGILPGGGSSLLRAKKALYGKLAILDESEDFKMGYKAFADSLSTPIMQNLTNAGIPNKEIIIDQIYNNEKLIGYNINAKQICDMVEAGVIDSCEAQCSAIMSATTNTKLLIAIKYMIVNVQTKENKDKFDMM